MNGNDSEEVWNALSSIRDRVNNLQADLVATRLVLHGVRNQLERQGIIDQASFDLLLVKVADEFVATMPEGLSSDIKNAVARQLNGELPSADVVPLNAFRPDCGD
ncbi:hypothetical protein [Leisingera sp. ANG59]|uniref:hypothetical protein n=1 Tax=Leisingera sp. ANG59 TaxID=2675221 RepID=UPI001573F205|nr:hypothetical protein [Leisingera sp. ANG59]NSY39070.1 hypothetical protein [Leisingera sp. ANG59]